MTTLYDCSGRLTIQDNQPPPDAPKAPRSTTKSIRRDLNLIALPVGPRGKGKSVEGTLGKIDQRGATAPLSGGPTTKHNGSPMKWNKLAFHVTRYLRPMGPAVVDQIDLVPGTGMRSTDTICLHCGRTLRPYGISHLKGDGSCPYDCNHCKTRDHQGQLCPRLWLFHSFQHRHGLHMGVHPNLQVRPTPEDLVIITRDYPQYRSFAASVIPAGEKKGTEPKKRRAPEEHSKSEELAQKRRQKDYADLEARVKVIEAQLQRHSEELVVLRVGESKGLNKALAEFPEENTPEAIFSPPQLLESDTIDRGSSVDALLEQALQKEAVLYARLRAENRGEKEQRRMCQRGTVGGTQE
ncbi:hypothetical protein PTNB73_00216 [Pyrenophora teres f. teres]|uniref:Uncharacterized protein n=1 Tax=Pyrenophora teres f. teres TaxID=97479 RepID=A0A6S6VV71_9PLEO|nr:hypothetical protein HRS9139_01459 [Pyrenophora teres f. teres]KAE8850767.1 hypothetical protein PTNB85_01183 [Pyrenophora teres f. teres]KAE8869873.1 hypothetical protein PTNB29_00217 [Pyrenophora teres f. teres]KAE8873584.1 hypothetical protein PTNB73_00216 [Pyrenophora teres f. teres]CAE7008580.1 hypothetical protein PTTW11_01715 [Pyrenophora teres f. teres]